MARIIIGGLLIAFYVLGSGGHFLNILSGDPNPMGIARDRYIAVNQQVMLYGLFVFVLPGVLLIYFGHRYRKQKKEKAQDQRQPQDRL